jgi:NAD(P)-dependent dehydrogenase (short-subunit alcohol dehydrogenase family)
MSIASASPKVLVLSARSKSRASPVGDKIASAYPNVKVEILEMDLDSLSSVRNAAKNLDVTLDVLICNAGIMAVPYSKSEDAFEKQFGINHLGHFLFTNLLLKEGMIRNGGRIVIVTSDGHRLSDILWEDPGFQV